MKIIYQRPEALNPPIQSNIRHRRFLLLREHGSKTRLRFQLLKVSIILSFAKFIVFLSIAESSSSAIQGQSVIFNVGRILGG